MKYGVINNNEISISNNEMALKYLENNDQ